MAAEREIIISAVNDTAQRKQMIVVEIYGEPLGIEEFIQRFDRSVDRVGVESYTGNELKGGTDAEDDEARGNGCDQGQDQKGEERTVRAGQGTSREQIRSAPGETGDRTTTTPDRERYDVVSSGPGIGSGCRADEGQQG